jgi:hypothetical protein
MALRSKTDVELAGELEAVATGAAERLRAVSRGDLERDADFQGSVVEAASRAIAAGVSLAAIADAERIGQGRARAELGPELLRHQGPLTICFAPQQESLDSAAGRLLCSDRARAPTGRVARSVGMTSRATAIVFRG